MKVKDLKPEIRKIIKNIPAEEIDENPHQIVFCGPNVGDAYDDLMLAGYRFDGGKNLVTGDYDFTIPHQKKYLATHQQP